MKKAMKEKLLAIVRERSMFNGNPYVRDDWADAFHEGCSAVCEDILNVLEMTWEDWKQHESNQRR